MPIDIAVIPARGGSKRIPRKNVRPLGGQPMIYWPIQTAVSSGRFGEIVVSTDDEEISRIAFESGASHCFFRAADLSDDFTPLRPVINDAIQHAERHFNDQVRFACCILATAILLDAADLEAGYQAVAADGFQFAFAASHFASPVQRAFRQVDTGGVEMVFPEHRLTRSQDLEPLLFDAGQFYWGQRDAFLRNDAMYGHRSKPIIIPRSRSCDIDTPEDLEEAELLFRLKSEKKS